MCTKCKMKLKADGFCSAARTETRQTVTSMPVCSNLEKRKAMGATPLREGEAPGTTRPEEGAETIFFFLIRPFFKTGGVALGKELDLIEDGVRGSTAKPKSSTDPPVDLDLECMPPVLVVDPSDAEDVRGLVWLLKSCS